jgi:hypothetical protein
MDPKIYETRKRTLCIVATGYVRGQIKPIKKLLSFFSDSIINPNYQTRKQILIETI